MSKHVCRGMFLAGLGVAVSLGFLPTSVNAQLFSRGCNRNCNRNCNQCQRPTASCNCTAQHPVVETQMVPQQVTTYRNEVVTQYRQEAFTQNVPVTTFRDMVADEGGYQTVYVPKMVTKRVPQTVYQQQTAYRSVPVQVTRQVPQVVTQMVPQQVTRLQPYSYQTTYVPPVIPTAQIAPVYAPMVGCAPLAPSPVASQCLPCGGTAYAPTPIYSPVIGQTYISNPVTMLPPQSAVANPTPAYSDSSRPVPDPRYLDSPGAARDPWTTVGSKSGSPSGNYEEARTSSTSGVRFKPAQTVYRAWESQSRVAASDAPARN